MTDPAETLRYAWREFVVLVALIGRLGPLEAAGKLMPFVLLFELPVYATILAGVFLHWWRQRTTPPVRQPHHPSVSCIVACYAEGDEIRRTVHSLLEQLYPGKIEILLVVDGSLRNAATLRAAEDSAARAPRRANRSIIVLPKPQRGGRVSSINAGLAVASGEIVMALDGDTSFDNDMVANAARYFRDPNVAGVAGNLRVRNARATLVTRLQAVEYMLSIHTGKIGLDHFNVVNNISGAFGVFRRDFVRQIGGWDSGTAEDLDLTIRIKKYFGRHPNLRIRFAPDAMGHTDAPDTLRGFFKQRHRWDGDLFYLYVRKHWRALTPALLGWRNFVMLMWTGVYFQLVLPFAIALSTVWVFCTYSIHAVLAVLLLVYLFYLLLTVILYAVHVGMVSERPRQDLALWWCLPLFPLLAFATRVWCGISTVSELVFKAHLDSSMAPWWVLRKTKF